MSYTLSICCPFLQFDSSVRRTIDSFLLLKELLKDYSDTCVSIVCVTSSAPDLENIYLVKNADSFIYSSPKGVYSAFNTCINLSLRMGADWIWIIGAGDTIVLSRSDIPLFLSAIRQCSSPISMGMYIGDRVSHPAKRYSSALKYHNLDKMRVNHPSTIVPSDIYRSYGLYSTSHRVVSDYLFVHTLLRSNVMFTILNIYAVYHELGGVSTSLTKFRLGEHLACLHILWSVYGFSSEFCFAVILRLMRYLGSFFNTRKL